MALGIVGMVIASMVGIVVLGSLATVLMAVMDEGKATEAVPCSQVLGPYASPEDLRGTCGPYR
jgi:hypothetical protein